jgi:N4-gp56 family major capsid protein
MALKEFAVNDPMAVKLYSRKLTLELLKETEIATYIGKDPDTALFTLHDDMSKGPGDQVTFPLFMNITGPPIQGDDILEGNEQQITHYTASLLINQLRNAVKSAGKMSEQRVPFSVRDVCKRLLKNYWSDYMAKAMFYQLCGYTAEDDTRLTGNNAVVGPTSGTNWIWSGGAGADASIDSSDIFSLADIDTCMEMAKTMSPAIRPIQLPRNVEGSDKMYVIFIHPYQLTSLRKSAVSAGSWFDIQKAAMQGGQITKNPIFTGAAGFYNGTLIKVDSRIPNGITAATDLAISTTRRAVFCGAQAGAIAFGQGNSPGKFFWHEELTDYKNSLGVACGTIVGIKKVQYNSADYGTIVVSSYATAGA